MALVLDHLLGETNRFHPLVGFGKLAQASEVYFNTGSPLFRLLKGTFAIALLITPISYLIAALRPSGSFQIFYDAVIVYFCLGFRSLREHTSPIASALEACERISHDELANSSELLNARKYTSYIVSRDADSLDTHQCARAAIESLLENGNDAIFATVFWYILLGPVGAVLHRLLNTLDAMWGYRTERYEWFGKTAARVDDVLAWVPARLTATSYSLTGNTIRALRCWRLQAHRLSSPNGGPCMTAGAGSLGVTLGGPCRYHGNWVNKPWFGEGPAPTAKDIYRAQRLLMRSMLLWLTMLGLFCALSTSVCLVGGSA